MDEEVTIYKVQRLYQHASHVSSVFVDEFFPMGSLGDQKLVVSKKIREHEVLGETHKVSHDFKKGPIGWG